MKEMSRLHFHLTLLRMAETNGKVDSTLMRLYLKFYRQEWHTKLPKLFAWGMAGTKLGSFIFTVSFVLVFDVTRRTHQ